MRAQDTSQLKDKIISLIRFKGPSLPAFIASDLKISILFTSAFLSELVWEKRLRASNMRVGSSPLYFIPGQENSLENFGKHLKSKEKDAFEILKEKGFLRDSEQSPAIKVALKAIKDFAIPFSKDDELYWRYLNFSEEQVRKKLEPLEKEEKEQSENEVKTFETNKPEEKELNILDNPKKEKKKKIKKLNSKKNSGKKNDQFFNKVKEFLAKKSIEILDIQGFTKNDLTLKVNINGGERLLVAYNKKTINELDVLRAYKKASESGLKFMVLSFGEPLKKLSNMIEAVQNLEEVERID